MDLCDLFTPEAVIPSLKASSKKQLLQVLASHAAPITGLSEQVIFDIVLQRERLGSTGVGNGIAIPHGRITGLGQVYGLFARLEEPIEFDAADDQPVDLVFLLLAPEDAGASHLKALARVSRQLRNEAVAVKLREAGSAEQLHEILTTDHAASKAA